MTSNNGEIIDNGDTVDEVSAPNGTATLTAKNGIGATVGAGFTNSIETTVAQLIASTTNSNIDIVENDTLLAVDINAGTGDVSLLAAESITDTDALTDVTGDDLRISVDGPGTIGTAANSIDVLGTTLVTSTAVGDQYFSTATSIVIGTDDLDAGAAHTVHLTNGTFFTTAAGGDIFSPTELSSGATLAGTGEVTGTVNALNGSTLAPGFNAPGVQPGILNTGSITMTAGVAFNVQFAGTTPGNTATDHDQLNTTGTVTLNNATLNLSAISGFVPSDGDSFTIINNDGADVVNGTFNGLPDDAIIADFLGSGLYAQIHYDGGTGNDVVFNAFAAETSVEIVAGDLVITDINGGTSNDNLTITLDGSGTHYVISDTVLILGSAHPGATGVGTTSITIPVADVTGTIQFVTLAGNDTITIDYANSPFPFDFAINGGGETVSDKLVLQNGTFSTVTYDESGVGAGTITFAGPADATITYSNLEDIADSSAVQNRVFNFNGGAETISVTDPVAMDVSTTINSTAGTSVNFVNPTVSFAINAGSGNDIINLSAVDAGFAPSVSIDGGASNDSITNSAALTLGTGNAGTVSMTAETITINAAINTTAGTTETITLVGSTIALNAGLTTDSGSVTLGGKNDITFAAAGDITSTSGTISVTSTGGKITQTDGSLLDAGSGKIFLSALNDITLGGLLTASAASDAIGVTTTNGAIVDGGDAHVDVSAANGTATLTAKNGIGSANAIETTVAQLVASTTNNGTIAINETDALSAIDLNAGTGNVTLTAGGAITDADASIDITGSTVAITISGAGVALGTTSNPIALDATVLTTSTNAADQYLSEADSVTIGTADLSAGAANTVHLASGIFFTTAAGGDITSKAEVRSGATLAGTGSVTGTVNALSSSTVAPGIATSGILTTSAVTMTAGTNFNVEIGGNVAGNYDQLATSGSVTLGNATLNLAQLGAFQPANGDTFTIINNGSLSAVSGTFNGLPEGAVITNFFDATHFARITYVGGDGNDVVLSAYVAETSVTLDGAGNLIITDINGGVSNDSLTITLDGLGNYVISDPSNVIATTIAGSTGNGTNSVTVPVASVTGTIQFNTLAGNDAIIVDYANGLFIDDMTIDGGAQATADTLTLQNATFTTITDTATGVGAGSIAFAGPANGAITYSNIEGITDLLTASNRAFNFDGGAETIVITDAAAANGRTNITSTLGTAIDFTNPTVSFSVNVGSNNDVINVTAVDSGFTASVLIDGGAGTDTLTSNAALTLGSGTSLGTVSLTAETLAINQPINTTAVATGTIDLSGDNLSLIHI